MGDERYSARFGRRAARTQRVDAARRSDRLDEVLDQPVDEDRIARVRRVATAFHRHEAAVQHRCQFGAGRMRSNRVLLAVDHEEGCVDPLAHAAERPLAVAVRGSAGLGQHRRWHVETPLDAILDLFGRVRLTEHLIEEELEEVLVLALPVVRVVLGPTLRGVEWLVEGILLARGNARRQRHRRADGNEPQHTLGMICCELQAPERATRQRYEHRRVGVRGIEDCERVGSELEVRIRGRVSWPPREACATPVEGDHTVATSQGRDLRLPEP